MFTLTSILTFSCSQALDFTSPLFSDDLETRSAITADRTYYIAAVDEEWDYAPAGTKNPFTGILVQDDLEARVNTRSGYHRIGTKYIKAVYREYTDATFTTQVPRPAKYQHLGVLGPAIRAVVGERIKVHFKNMANGNYSIHPHGVSYNTKSEGAMYQRLSGDASFSGSHKQNPVALLKGEEWVYIWDVPTLAAGTDDEFSSKLWWYHSHVVEAVDTNTGLIGPILITKKGFATSNDDLKPNDVDREFVTLFTTFDENESWYLLPNLFKYAESNSSDTVREYAFIYTEEALDDLQFHYENFYESNLMYSMNGFTWNALGPYMGGIYKGERVRFYVGAMGTEFDIHTAHWHGNLVKSQTVTEDVVQLLPAYATTVDMLAENPGTWFYHCHVNEHVEAGMVATYTVLEEECEDCVGFAELISEYESYSSDSSDEAQTFGEMMGDTEIRTGILIGLLVAVCLVAVYICFCVRRYPNFSFQENKSKTRHVRGMSESKQENLETGQAELEIA